MSKIAGIVPVLRTTEFDVQTMKDAEYPEMETLPNIEPLSAPTWKEKFMGWKRYWTTKEGWIGDYVLYTRRRF